MKLVTIIFILLSCSKNLDQARIPSSAETPRRNFTISPEAAKELKRVNWKLIFNELFAKHVHQDNFNSPITYPPFLKLKESVYFNRRPFEDIFQEITKEKSSLGVFEKRDEVLSNDRILKSLILGKITRQNFYHTAAKDFVKDLNEEFKKSKAPIGNYFETSLGSKVMDILENTVFIILPGFGNHIIQEMVLPDLVEDINEYYGRERTRTFTKNGIFSGFLDFREYYKKPDRPHKFDIIQPMGKDTGTTFSTHNDNAFAIKEWIKKLPEFYHNKEIVFVGYSKGSTLASHIVASYPEIRDRTRAIFSLGGPLQGSNLAENLSRNIYNLDTTMGIKEFRDKLKELPGKIELEPIIKSMAKNSMNEYIFIKTVMNNFPYLSEENKIYLKKLLEKISSDDARVIMEGLYEEGTTYMLDWNLKYLNQDSFDRPISLFNLSFLTNYKDFFVKGPVGEEGSKLPPEVVPQFLPNGLDTKSFSLDMVSQLIISLNNIENTEGGLSDSMVSWNSSKFPIFDQLPLKASYTQEVLTDSYDSNSFIKEKFSYEEYISMPRKNLFNRRGTDNMEFIDLGEVRGTHWSCMFRQVVRIPDIPENQSHVHSFPHKAMFKALIETYGIYKLIRD